MLIADTSFLIQLEEETRRRSRGPAMDLLGRYAHERIAISVVTVGEFAEGFRRRDEAEKWLERFPVLQLSIDIAYRAADLQRKIPAKLGENDAWIAATALVYGAPLLGKERAFARVPRLQYVECG